MNFRFSVSFIKLYAAPLRQAFKIQSKQLSTKMWCQNMKVYFIGFGALLVIGLIVLFSTCGFTLSKCKST